MKNLSREHLLELPGVLLAMILALPTIAYPFVRDQAAYWYVGKIWAQGGLPYVDAFDHKPPAIYLLYKWLYKLAGDDQSAIRIAEILVIPIFAFLIAKVVSFSNKGESKAAYGAAALMVVAFYFFPFSIRETATVEYWESLFLLAGLYCALSYGSPWASFATGCFIGTACLFKFTAVLPGLIPLMVLIYRGQSRGWIVSLQNLALFVAGGSTLTLLMLAPFAMAGQLDTVWAAVIAFNLHYATNMTVLDIEHSELLFSHLLPFTALSALSTVAMVALTSGQKRKLWLLLTAHSILIGASVFIQRGLVMHFTVLAPFMALPVVGLIDFISSERVKHPVNSTLVSVVISGALLLMAPRWLGQEAIDYPTYSATWLKHISNPQSSQFAFDKTFKSMWFFNYTEIRGAGMVIQDNMEPGDELCVWDYEPGLYNSSGLTCPSRFFIPHFFLYKGMKYNNKDWLNEHQRSMKHAKPRFMALRVHQQGDIAGLKAAGYTVLGTFGPTQILMRPGSQH